MGCQHCRSSGAGAVRFGTQGYTRVKQGRCPYCGGRPDASSGKSIGFSGGSSSSEFLGEYQVEQARARTRRWIKICLFFIACCALSIGGRLGNWRVSVWGCVGGGVFFLIASIIIFASYSFTKKESHANYDKSDIPSRTAGIIICLICIYLTLLCLNVISFTD